jgi:uncharacterized protein YukE
MIIPPQVPEIPGDMDALAHHASALRAAGGGFAGTGADVHATWQRLAPSYVAPESGQLLAATAPVKATSVRVGREMEAVAAALATYAETVKPIKERLETLRAQVRVTEGGDGGAALTSQVNQAIEDWLDAQRACAASINAVHGDTDYPQENGAGHGAPFPADPGQGSSDTGGTLPFAGTASFLPGGGVVPAQRGRRDPRGHRAAGGFAERGLAPAEQGPPGADRVPCRPAAVGVSGSGWPGRAG